MQKDNFRGHRAEIIPADYAIICEEKKKEAEIFGTVTDCVKLNIRKEPNPGAEIVAVIPAGSEVVVDSDTSSSGFYKVCTPAGVEGFCMKNYIVLRQ